jgi:hypothetical protein
MDTIKINILGFDDLLIEYLTELYIDNKDFQYIKNNDHWSYTINDQLALVYKNKLKYLQESNQTFFKDTKGIIIIFKTKDIEKIKDIWLNEIYYNCPHNSVPILFLEVESLSTSIHTHLHLPHSFYTKYKYVAHSTTSMDNKDLIKKIYDNFINKVSRVDQRAK